MRGFRAKALMKMVRWERAAEVKVVERDLVIDKRGVVRHSPDSIRMLYQAVKRGFYHAVHGIGARLYFDRSASEETMQRARVRLAGDTVKARDRKELVPQPRTPLKTGGIARIQNPLRLIGEKCPASQLPNGDWEPHPTLVKARRLANQGRGAEVRNLARSLLAA